MELFILSLLTEICRHVLLITVSMEAPVTFFNPHNLLGVSQREISLSSAKIMEAHVPKCKKATEEKKNQMPRRRGSLIVNCNLSLNW